MYSGVPIVIPIWVRSIFFGSLAIILFLMSRLVRELEPAARRTLVGTAIIIFVYRAIPTPGAGSTWWMIDDLGFDQQFLSVLSLIAAGITLLGMFIFRRFMAEKSIAYIVVFLTIVSTVLALPIIGGMVSQNLLNIVDTAMVGFLGDPALAAVGMSSFVVFMCQAVILGISTGVQSTAARKKGEGRPDRAAAILNSALLLVLLVAPAFSVILIELADGTRVFFFSDPALQDASTANSVPNGAARIENVDSTPPGAICFHNRKHPAGWFGWLPACCRRRRDAAVQLPADCSPASAGRAHAAVVVSVQAPIAWEPLQINT